MKKMFGILGLLLLSTVISAQERSAEEMRERDESRCSSLKESWIYKYEIARKGLNIYLNEYTPTHSYYNSLSLVTVENKLRKVMIELWQEEQNMVPSKDLIPLKNNFSHWPTYPSLNHYVLSMEKVFDDKNRILAEVKNKLLHFHEEALTLKTVPEKMGANGITRVCLLVNRHKIDHGRWPVVCNSIDIKEDAQFAEKNMILQRFIFQNDKGQEKYSPLIFNGIDFNLYPNVRLLLREKLGVAQCPYDL